MKNGQKSNQRKISKTHLILLIAAAVLVIVALFFGGKLIWGNPLAGEWATSKGELHLTLEEDTKKEAKFIVLVGEEPVEVKFDYQLDKKEKTITFLSEPEDFELAVEELEGRVSALALYEEVEDLLVAMEYSLEKDTLKLTEREYGEQIIFTKVK